MPDKLTRLHAIERYMGSAVPGPRRRPPPPPDEDTDEKCFLLGGQGYRKDDATRSVIESEFFLDKGDIMKRVKEIVNVLKWVLSAMPCVFDAVAI